MNMCALSSLRPWLTFIAVGVASVAGLLAVSNEASAQLHFDVLHTFPTPGGLRPYAPLIQATDGNFYGTTQAGGASNVGTVFKITPSGTKTVIHSFSFSSEGGNPLSGLVQATDGDLYGTTFAGGASGYGSVFKVTTAGTLTVLHAFSSFSSDGADPTAGLVQATDGNLYGTTEYGGPSGSGTVFKITPAGALTILRAFGYGEGAGPGALIQAADGNLYGTTFLGGASGVGTVFRITTTGTLTVLHSFSSSSEGAYPLAGLIQTADGNLYGTTFLGGPSNSGTVFKITLTGTLTVLHAFGSSSDGADPQAGLIQATDGNLYGTTSYDGAAGYGTVFKITAAGTLTVLHAFSGFADGATPHSALVQGTDGNLWGTTVLGGPLNSGTIFKVTLTGTETVIDTFSGGTEGSGPRAALVELADGNLYGTTTAGGALDVGTVFKLTATGALTTLHAFDTGLDGANPYGALAPAADGNLYGTTNFGGPSGAGTVFQITTAGLLTVVHWFDSFGEGGYPAAGLVQGTDGNLYGTAQSGAVLVDGTIFQITPGWTLNVLHRFGSSDGTDGAFPEAALIQATDGSFYGTTQYGGASNAGTVFKLTAGGTYTILHEFSFDGMDGAYPRGGLVQATDGSLYGTTELGGAFGDGTVFRITPGGTLTVLHAFSASSEGAVPAAGLVQARDGNLYGTTSRGGVSDYGTVFKMTPGGTLTVLHAFSGGADGATPLAGVIQGTDGNLYGTTSAGGATGSGVIFRLASGVRADYDGDRKADLVVFRPSTGQWLVGQSTTSYSTVASYVLGGSSADTPVPGDYDGDGRTDLAVYRRSTGQWFVSLSSTNYSGYSVYTWGRQNDAPVPGDYDGDGKTDLAIYRPSTGQWFVLLSSTNYSMFTVYAWGMRGDAPVPGDYDGDGTTDLAIYRRSTGQWWIATSSSHYATFAVYQWGVRTDQPVPGDYDGDGKADLAVFRPSTGQWLILTSSSGYTASSVYTWGASTDTPVPADYDGDGKVDLAIFRPSTGQWWIEFSRTGYSTSAAYSLGTSTDIPATAVTAGPSVASITDTTRASDFDRDQRADLAIFRPSTGQWLIDLSGTNYSSSAAYTWGVSTDTPVPGDYDGDGKTDLAVYRPSTGQWLIAFSGTNYSTSAVYYWGASTDTPVPGDYDGDGKTDLAVFRPSTGQWVISLSSTNYTTSVAFSWGISTDVPVPGDYDGDGRTDIAVYRRSSGQWLMLLSSANYASVVSRTWGTSADVPVPGDYDGDGLTDLAVYNPYTARWVVLQSSTGDTTYASYSWGGDTYSAVPVAVPADYDGDGKTDLAVFQPSTGQWFIAFSRTNYSTSAVYTWGISTDMPLVRRQ